MHFSSLLFCTLFSLFPFNAGQCSKKPILLTDSNNEPKQVIELNSSAQCVPAPSCIIVGEGGETKTYGLSFRLPIDVGQCDDGILICYPGTLDRFTGGDWSNIAVPKKQCRIVNKNNTNFAAQNCEKNWKSDGRKNGPIWHGIYVYTKKMNGTRHTMMELSFLAETLDFGPNKRQLSIPFFGNQSVHFDYIKTNKATGEVVREVGDDDSLGRNFMENVQNGVFLRDFVGLWVLGLDMLPRTAADIQDRLNLHIYRGCNCSMEAWFTRPTDTEKPAHSGVITVGTANCAKTINGHAEFDYRKKGEFAINLIGLTGHNADDIIVELIESPADKAGAILAALSMGIHKANQISSNEGSILKMTKRLNRGSNTLNLTFELHTYSFGIRVNNTHLGDIKQFWPAKEWWNGLSDKIQVKLSGEMMLLNDPSLDKNSDQHQPTERLPFVQKLQYQVFNGTAFSFRFKFDDNKEFNLFLLHDRPDFHDYIGATILHMRVDPKFGVYFDVFAYGKLQFSESAKEKHTFKAGQAYEFHIDVLDKEYQMKINGQSFKKYSNSMPIWSINFIRVEGNVSLLSVPEIYMPNRIQKGTSSFRLPHLFNYGDQLTILIEVKDADNFTINFMHESSEANKKIGDVVLQLVFNISNQSVQCFHIMYMENDHLTNCQNGSFVNHTLKRGGYGKLQILAASDGFYGRFDGMNIRRFCQYYHPTNKSVAKMPIPPWSIDHIQVVGNVHAPKLTKIPALRENWNDRVITWNQIPFTQINLQDGLLQSGESILILMKLHEGIGTKLDVAINLFNEALDFHDLIGKTALKVKLNNNKLTFNSFYNKHWMVPDGNTSYTFTTDLATSMTELKIEIIALDNGFSLALNGKDEDINRKKLIYPSNVPAWAVQYITVSSKPNELRNLTVICKPENRCV